MKVRLILLLVGALAVFGAVNWQIALKERLRTGGATVYLPLAPVDPRSIMQGDYMALNFDVAMRIHDQLGTEAPDGPYVAVLLLDDRRVASFKRLDNGAPLGPGELRFRFRIRDGQVWLGTNAFFMQEGAGDRYAPARFGEFHVNESGEAMLVDLRNENLRKL